MVDAGPIVALLQEGDERHAWARQAVASIRRPLYTCEPVITEAAHLMRRKPGGRDAVLELITKGIVVLAFHMEAELDALRTLVVRYASVPMSLADACLVRMSEITPDSAILTFDTDFRVYRRGGRQPIPVMMPPTR